MMNEGGDAHNTSTANRQHAASIYCTHALYVELQESSASSDR